MGRNNYFQFKKFKIVQEKSAMKVGTDGILLGAWTDTSTIKTILDIGTGTGLIALMLAQRCSAEITGIEIEKSATAEAKMNFATSPWANRMIAVNSSIQDFAQKTSHTFDLIVSNPPFFENSLKSTQKNKNTARHTDALPFAELLFFSKKLLSKKGKCAFIIPAQSLNQFLKLSEENLLFPTRITEIKSKQNKQVTRILMELASEKTILKKDCFAIYNPKGSNYTDEYKNQTRDYYLNF